MTTTWNPSDKASPIVLSGGNLTAALSTTPGGQSNVRGTNSGGIDNFFEVLINANLPSGDSIGVANLSASLTNYVGNDTNSIGYTPNGYYGFNGSFTGGLTGYGIGDVVGVRINSSSVSFYLNGVLQATTTGTFPAGSLYPFVSLTNSGDSVTANFGATTFAFLPSGASSWDAPPAPPPPPPTPGIGSDDTTNALNWSFGTFPPQMTMFARRSLSRSGGQTLSGVDQVVQSSTDFWAASIAFKIRSKQQILAYRALQARNWGRAGLWIIPACPQLGVPSSPPPADFSFAADWAADFSSGDIPSFIPPGEGALVTVQSLRGSRTVTCQFIDPAFVPLPGMYFSIGSRLYLIGTVFDLGTHTFTMTFSPGLRWTATVGTAVEFSSPRCLMRLAEDNVGEMSLDFLRFSDITLNFVEVPPNVSS